MKRVVLLMAAAAAVPLVLIAAVAVLLLLEPSSAAPNVAACPGEAAAGPGTQSAPSAGALSPEDQRTENLAALARMWGVVRYFHPYVAGKDIDWDAALVESVESAASATSAPEMEAALDKMLSKLEDPATRVVAGPLTKDSESVNASLGLTWGQDGVAILKACYSEASSGWEEALREVPDRVRAVVFDLREGPGQAGGGYERALREALVEVLPFVLSEPVSPAPEIYVKYQGYPAQTGGSPSYTRRFDKDRGETIMPALGDGRAPRLVFLTGERTPNVFDLLAALQAEAKASVLFAGPADQARIAAARVYGMDMPFGLVALVRTTEIEAPGGAGFVPDELLEIGDTTGKDRALNRALRLAHGGGSPEEKTATKSPGIKSLVEQPYASMTSPSRDYRLLALFRLWNVIEHFFPYRDLMDEPWEDTLRGFIPRFEAASSEEDYIMAIVELAAKIGDSHVSVSSQAVADLLGTGWPAVVLRPVEGKMVVVRVLDEETRRAGVGEGDVVRAVDGVPAETRAEEISRLRSESTPQARQLRIAQYLLRGPENSTVDIELLNADGKMTRVSLPRRQNPQTLARSTPIFSVLPEGIGYIDLARVTRVQLDEAFRVVRDTSGLILDMRGYPNGVFPFLAGYLGERTGTAARFERPEPDGLHLGSRPTYLFLQAVPQLRPNRYGSPVAVLINEEAISQAEHTLLHLEATRDVTFIGTPTQGANGDVTSTVLPGGIDVRFTGQGVSHADGRQLQRVGVQPHIFVAPTIAGVRAGRDEVLEAGVAFLTARGN